MAGSRGLARIVGEPCVELREFGTRRRIGLSPSC